MRFTEFLQSYLIFIAMLSFHEWAHAFVADKLGDDTPRVQKRLTLNPLSHIDPIGTVLIPLLSFFGSGYFSLIGWARPVQVNPDNFKNPRRDDTLVALAGPAMNILLAAILGFIAVVLLKFQQADAGKLVVQMCFINIFLAVFNMVPIPPLDGSHLVKNALRIDPYQYARFMFAGGIILLVLIQFPFFRNSLQAVSVDVFNLMTKPWIHIFGLS